MRTREVWVHAVDLDNGATFSDIHAPQWATGRGISGITAEQDGETPARVPPAPPWI